jgi:hypothetical protein
MTISGQIMPRAASAASLPMMHWAVLLSFSLREKSSTAIQMLSGNWPTETEAYCLTWAVIWLEGTQMADFRKQKLIGLGTETLAEALLDLALHSDAADDLIEQLIATPKENVQRFKKKLAGLKRSRRYIERRGSFGFSQKLCMLLQDLKAGVDDPLTGVDLVATFYKSDKTIFEI